MSRSAPITHSPEPIFMSEDSPKSNYQSLALWIYNLFLSQGRFYLFFMSNISPQDHSNLRFYEKFVEERISEFFKFGTYKAPNVRLIKRIATERKTSAFYRTIQARNLSAPQAVILGHVKCVNGGN